MLFVFVTGYFSICENLKFAILISLETLYSEYFYLKTSAELCNFKNLINNSSIPQTLRSNCLYKKKIEKEIGQN